jgi:hypothetical protein
MAACLKGSILGSPARMTAEIDVAIRSVAALIVVAECMGDPMSGASCLPPAGEYHSSRMKMGFFSISEHTFSQNGGNGINLIHCCSRWRKKLQLPPQSPAALSVYFTTTAVQHAYRFTGMLCRQPSDVAP